MLCMPHLPEKPWAIRIFILLLPKVYTPLYRPPFNYAMETLIAVFKRMHFQYKIIRKSIRFCHLWHPCIAAHLSQALFNEIEEKSIIQ